MQGPTFTTDETGSVTAEYAVLLPVIVFSLALILGVAGVGIERIQVEEAARVGARILARGESNSQAAAAAQQIAGHDSGATAGTDGVYVTFEVHKNSSIPVLGWVLPPHTVTATTVAEVNQP